jgi:hypothetical protein
MKRIIFTLLIFTFFSCQKNNDNLENLNSQIDIYRTELKKVIDTEDLIIQFSKENSKSFKARVESHTEIINYIKNSINQIGINNRDKILERRDSLNKALKLKLYFVPSKYYKNIDDSIFKKTIDIDFLRLKKHYQEAFILPFKPRQPGI